MKKLIPFSVIKSRRQKIIKKIGKALFILPAAKEQIRNADCNYKFRQNSDFWYLTQFNEANAVIVLDGKSKKSYIFNKANNKTEEIWEGKTIGQERAKSEYLFDESIPIENLEEKLFEIIKQHERIITPFTKDIDFDQLIIKIIKKLQANKSSSTIKNWQHTDIFVHPMRLIKDKYEIESIKYAVSVSAKAHISAMEETKSGINEREISALFDYNFAKKGGCSAYNNIVAGGSNACTLHYVSNNKKLTNNTLVLIDAGCEINGYASDVTRTFPVNGVFSETQKKIYSWVLKAVKDAIKECKQGKNINSPHKAAEKTLVKGMIELGLLSGSIEDILKNKKHTRYFMHGTSHWMGIDVHDVGDYKNKKGHWKKLKEGMIFTIEPGIYIDKNDLSAPKELRGIGIRLEENILITREGSKNLTKDIPIEINDVENACKGNFYH